MAVGGAVRDVSDGRPDTIAASAKLRFIRALRFVPQNSTAVWAALDGAAALYRSDDGGRSWRVVNVLRVGESVGTFAVDQSGQYLYVAAKYHPLLWQSSDGGATWRRLTGWPKLIVPIGRKLAESAVATAIVIDRTRPELVYAVSENVVLRSADAGQTWSRASRGLPAGLPYYPWYGGDLVEHPLDAAALYFVSH
jgi:photosystem II stability/assembly factor-like uncharacterized protein